MVYAHFLNIPLVLLFEIIIIEIIIILLMKVHNTISGATVA